MAVKPGVGGAGCARRRQAQLADHARSQVRGTCAGVERQREPGGAERQVNGRPYPCQLQLVGTKTFTDDLDGHRGGENCALCQ